MSVAAKSNPGGEGAHSFEDLIALCEASPWSVLEMLRKAPNLGGTEPRPVTITMLSIVNFASGVGGGHFSNGNCIVSSIHLFYMCFEVEPSPKMLQYPLKSTHTRMIFFCHVIVKLDKNPRFLAALAKNFEYRVRIRENP